MSRFPPYAILLAVMLIVPLARAAEGSRSPSDGLDLRALIELSAVRLHKRFIIDPRVKGTVTVAGIDPDTLTYAELQSILSVHGFITTPERNGTIEILPDTNARQIPVPVATGQTRTLDAEDMVTKTIDVGTLDATQLVPMLRPLLPQSAHLAAHAQTNSLLIVARQENVAALEAIIRDLQKNGTSP